MTLERLHELSSVMSGLQQELAVTAKEHAQEMLDELKARFASLPNPGGFHVLGSSANSISVAWEFLSYETITFKISAPFTQYEALNSNAEWIAQFDSLFEMVEAVRSWVADAISLASSTQKVLSRERGFELERVWMGQRGCDGSAPGFSALHFFSPGNLRDLDVDRAIEIAVGPFEQWCHLGSHTLEKGEVSILLCRRENGEEQVAPYSFTSTEEAIVWLSEHLDDLSNPEEFDAACKE